MMGECRVKEWGHLAPFCPWGEQEKAAMRLDLLCAWAMAAGGHLSLSAVARHRLGAGAGLPGVARSVSRRI